MFDGKLTLLQCKAIIDDVNDFMYEISDLNRDIKQNMIILINTRSTMMQRNSFCNRVK